MLQQHVSLLPGWEDNTLSPGSLTCPLMVGVKIELLADAVFIKARIM